MTKRIREKFSFLLMFFFLVGFSPLLGKNPKINRNKGKYAIGGYDPVSYFVQKKPQKGKKKYKYRWKKAKWLFANKKHLTFFKKNPKKYAPQYGGYCSFAVSRGFSQSVSPKDSWTIYKGKLYLNYNRKIYKKWNSDKEGYIKKANKIWPKSLKKNPPN